MIKSMTGFGKSDIQLPNKKVSVEIKTLNSKSMNLSVKLPEQLRNIEQDVKNLISKKLVRGKIEVCFTIDSIEASEETVINRITVANYFKELTDIYKFLQVESSPESILKTVMNLPGVLKPSKSEIEENEQEIILKSVDSAIEDLDNFRIDEGKNLQKDIVAKVNRIEELQIEIGKHKNERIEKIRERIKSRIAENISAEHRDDNRFEQEMIYYIEKLDINEEEIRLKNHCRYFIETLEELESGKKLGFIAQEMGREINTLGSKASHTEIQKIVIMMKDELEKIKEQLLNIL